MVDNFYHNKRVAVAGGTGFIGSFLVRELLNAGAVVFVIMREGGNAWRLSDIAPAVTVVPVDLFDHDATVGAFQSIQPEILFNLASLVRTEQSLAVVDDLLRGNVLITKHVLQAAVAVGVSKCVHVGSIEEYGHNEVPFDESLREAPISPYSMAKVAATHLVQLFHRLGGLQTCVVRPAATFGPRQSFGMLTPNLIKSCLEKKDFYMNPGDQMRDFIFVGDVARGMMAAGATPEAFGEVINLGSDKTYRVKEIALLINELLGRPITIHFGAYPYRPQDTMRFYMDSHKAHRLLGWRARTDLIAAMEETVQWYKEHYAEVH